MLLPTTVDILKNIENTLDTVVRPTVEGTAEQSALATVSHLLRHVALRIEHEGQILFDDIAALKAVLVDLQLFCTGINTGAEATLDTISAAIKRGVFDAGQYPSLLNVADELSVLHAALYEGLAYLQLIRNDYKDDKQYQQLRQQIRNYMGAQINAETRLVDPAFDNKGPRR